MYPKSCPRCGSKNITSKEDFGMRCNKCGFKALRNSQGDFFRYTRDDDE